MEKRIEEVVSINITFLLQPGKPWVSMSRFQQDLGEWLKTKNVDGVVINGLNDQSGNLIVYLKEAKPQPEPPKSPPKFPVK